MPLEKWAEALALSLQEADVTLSDQDIRCCLQDAVNDSHPGQYAYVCCYYGDDSSGDVVYSAGGDCTKCPYEISTVNGKRVCALNTDQAVDVMPRTVYDEEADEADHYASMGEAERGEKYTERFPGSAKWRGLFAERFISKDERAAADSGDFAGKGKSYPILKPGDVMAAVHAMGRAGAGNKSTSALKASIIRIAKKKGWAKYLPKAWQDGGDSSESGTVVNEGDLILVESAATTEAIVLREARADYEIKLIAPGKGSSAFYPAEVLKRDGPKVFTSGTHVYLNHATAAEEAARPEGDVRNLAGVLTGNAYYDESHRKGPGLYGRMKVFADHAQTVEEKAPHVGMSIRAAGVREAGQTKEGLPVLKSFTRAESVDVVTRAGAGGMILTEAARPSTQEVDMDEAQLTARIKEATDAATAPLLAELKKLRESEEAPKVKPKKAIRRMLESIRLPEAAKDEVVRNLKDDVPLTEAGTIDEAKLKPMVEKEAARIARLAESLGVGRVQGLGAPIQESKPEKPTPEEQLKESEDIYGRLMDNPEAAKRAAQGRRLRIAQ